MRPERKDHGLRRRADARVPRDEVLIVEPALEHSCVAAGTRSPTPGPIRSRNFIEDRLRLPRFAFRSDLASSATLRKPRVGENLVRDELAWVPELRPEDAPVRPLQGQVPGDDEPVRMSSVSQRRPYASRRSAPATSSPRRCPATTCARSGSRRAILVSSGSRKIRDCAAAADPGADRLCPVSCPMACQVTMDAASAGYRGAASPERVSDPVELPIGSPFCAGRVSTRTDPRRSTLWLPRFGRGAIDGVWNSASTKCRPYAARLTSE